MAEAYGENHTEYSCIGGRWRGDAKLSVGREYFLFPHRDLARYHSGGGHTLHAWRLYSVSGEEPGVRLAESQCQSLEVDVTQVPGKSATADDPSWGGAHHGAGLCPDHRYSGPVSLRPADRQLSGTDSLRGVQRRSLATGTHYQARQCADAVLAGGGGTDSSALRAEVATALLSSGAASRTCDR